MFRSGAYRVALAAGKMRRHRIPILLGDRIKLSSYDLTRGRIARRTGE